MKKKKSKERKRGKRREGKRREKGNSETEWHSSGAHPSPTTCLVRDHAPTPPL
jgi:hypothetical protein